MYFSIEEYGIIIRVSGVQVPPPLPKNHFAMGFILGASVIARVPIGQFIDINSIKYALIKYCKENPLRQTVDGTMHILEELRN